MNQMNESMNQMNEQTYPCLECGYKMQSSTRQLCGKTHCDNLAASVEENSCDAISFVERQFVQEFGEDALNKHFRFYCDVTDLEKHYLRCNNFSEKYINEHVDVKEVERKFLGILETEYGIGPYYHNFLKEHCLKRYQELGNYIRVFHK